MFNDRVIAVSEATRRFQRRWNLVPAGRLETIHNFIDCRRLAAVPADARSQVRRSLGIAADSPLLGVTGRIIRRKGLIHLVLRTAEDRGGRAECPGCWWWAGEKHGPYATSVRAAAERLGIADRIIWTGHRDDARELLPALDLFVLPSLDEDMPLVILEAMALGLAVVASSIGGISECVLHGQTGILTPPARSDALAEAVLELLGDPVRRRRLGEAGRRRVQEQFGLEGQTSRIETLLAGVVRRRAA